MHSEVAAYQEKLQQLEERQAELLSDNMELKELCLFLDHERSQVSCLVPQSCAHLPCDSYPR